MFHVSISYEKNRSMQFWDQILTNFGVPSNNVWVRNLPTDITNLYSGAYDQRYDVGKLQDKVTVVLAPPNGHYIKGTESLVDFVHPENCLYFFGADHEYLDDEVLEGLSPSNYVYIPQQDRHDMYSFCAASCVFYDRLVKNG